MSRTPHAARSPRPVIRSVLGFAVALVVFLALDAVWLFTMSDRLYRPAIGHLMREGFDVRAAALFYVLYITGMMSFVILPALNPRQALLRGALFGLIAYATYDLTNQATLRDWPWVVTMADLAWGAFVTGMSCTAAYMAVRRHSRIA